MVNAFGCPKHLVDLFKPQQSRTKLSNQVEDDVELLIHRAVKTGLSGAHLEALTLRYQRCLTQAIATESILSQGDSWIEFQDLNSFIEKRVFEAAVQSMFGTYMLSLNPTLADDFWAFNRAIGTLFMGLPRWLSPAAYRARDRMLQHIERWQRHAEEHSERDQLGDDIDWEPYYGSKFIRERQRLLDKRGILDPTARAAENFAFMWATNSNSVPAATWLLYEILRDSQLQIRVRKIISAHTPEGRLREETGKGVFAFDTSKLCSDPILQSLYAETLRLRVAVLVVREPVRENYSFRGWHIRKNEVLSVSTRTEAMNEDIWNTGSNEDPHPLDTMWADRFIADPNDPSSGPLHLPKNRKKKSTMPGNQSNGRAEAQAREPYFSMDGLSASWIPYGGGTSLCPGRHFAKQEIITTAAILLNAYDFELIHPKGNGRDDPQVDMSCFGFGTMPPDRAIPFRIRRSQGKGTPDT
ncbi:MAG: hypothetical protein Q9174_006568 [Haloplaca sp. 1 TL-2023]